MAPQFGFQQDFFDAVKNFLYSVRKTFSMPAHDAGFYNDVLLGAGLGGALGATTSGIPGAVGGAIVGGIQGANLNTYNNGVPVIDTSYLDKKLLPYRDYIEGFPSGEMIGGMALGGLLGGVPGAAAGGAAGLALGGIGGATPNSGYPTRDGMLRPGYRSKYGANPVYGPDEQRYMNQIPPRPPRPPEPWYDNPDLPFAHAATLGSAGAIMGGLTGGELAGPEGALAGLAIGGLGGATLGSGIWAVDKIMENNEIQSRKDKEYEQRKRHDRQALLLADQDLPFYKKSPNETRFMNIVPQMASPDERRYMGRVPSQAPQRFGPDEQRFMNIVPSQASPDERRFAGRVPSARPEVDEQRFMNRVPQMASPDERRYMGRVPSARPEIDEQRFMNIVPQMASPDERRFAGRVPAQAPPTPLQKNKQAEANRSQARDERRFINVVPSQGFPPRDERRFDKKPQPPSRPKTQAEANRSQAQDERRYMDRKPASKAIVKPPLDSYIKRYKRD